MEGDSIHETQAASLGWNWAICPPNSLGDLSSSESSTIKADDRTNAETMCYLEGLPSIRVIVSMTPVYGNGTIIVVLII